MVFSASKFVSACLVVTALGASAAAYGQTPAFYLLVDSRLDGRFKGDGLRSNPNAIGALGFDYGISVPTDQASGLASGKRYHLPLTITKELGASSPQFLHALLTNELLSTVELDFSKVNAAGVNAVYFKIVLKNATVTAIQQSVSIGANGVPVQVEKISLTYQSLVETDLAANTSVSDSWNTAN